MFVDHAIFDSNSFSNLFIGCVDMWKLVCVLCFAVCCRFWVWRPVLVIGLGWCLHFSKLLCHVVCCHSTVRFTIQFGRGFHSVARNSHCSMRCVFSMQCVFFVIRLNYLDRWGYWFVIWGGVTSCRCWGSFGLPCLVVASILRVFFACRDGSSHCHGVCYALQVFPGGHQVDGLPPASSYH